MIIPKYFTLSTHGITMPNDVEIVARVALCLGSMRRQHVFCTLIDTSRSLSSSNPIQYSFIKKMTKRTLGKRNNKREWWDDKIKNMQSSSFITPLAADNKIHTIHIKYVKYRNKKSYKVIVPAKTRHTTSLTYTQLFVSKSIPYLQPIAMNLFWCSLDSAHSIGLFEQCILYQNINLRWSTRKDIDSVLQKNWRGLG